MKSFYKNKEITIPSWINIFIALASLTACSFCLFQSSHTNSWPVIILCMLGFGYFGNTIFSLLHEAVHANFHHNRKVNYLFGNIFASVFPTGFSFQKRCHLNHHRNNRTEYELFETYHQEDIKFLRTATLYIVLTGVYWIIPFIGSIWFLLAPKSISNSEISGKNYKLGRIGSASMLRNFQNLSPKIILQMRLEIISMLIFQIAVFLILDLNFKGWFLCYASFALLWSSLQYSDHAYSTHDIRNGAWNLKVNPVTKIFFLNYHDHLAHHQYPHVPWIHLPKFVEPGLERPTFWSIYLRMWKGPIKIDRIHKLLLDPELEKLIDKENFTA